MTVHSAQLSVNATGTSAITGSILFIETIPEVRENITRILNASKLRVDACASCNDAISMVRSAPGEFRIVVLDMEQLGNSAHHHLRRLRQADDKLSLIVAPARKNSIPAEELYRLGVVALLPKPYDYDMLQRLVRAVLGQD